MASTEYRDTHAGGLRPEDAGTGVRLAGWAERIRDQGGVVFVVRMPDAGESTA
jgi:aspartyl-tRNA synthetase